MDPGPLERLDASMLARFPLSRSFEGIVADHLGNLAGADSVLLGAKADASTGSPADLETAYATTIAPAADALANDDATFPVSSVPELLGAGDNADARRVDAEKYLPDAGAPIDQAFTDPPAAPADIGEPGDIEKRLPPAV